MEQLTRAEEMLRFVQALQLEEMDDAELLRRARLHARDPGVVLALLKWGTAVTRQMMWAFMDVMRPELVMG